LDRRYVTAALMLVMTLASMEQTITSTAMPTIIGELHGLEHYSWVASLYLLACTVSMPLYGRLADVLGRKRVVLAAIGLFLVSSVLAASAHSMVQLIIYRGLQGLGAGGIMPVTLTILGDIFTLKERARVQGFFSIVWGTSSLAGPALGAFLVNTLGWRAVFFVNLPFGLLAMSVLMWKYHDHGKPHSTELDLPGVAGLSIACMSVLALVSRLGPDGWSWPAGTALLLTAVVATIAFVRHERRCANPILPPSLLAQRLVGPSMLASILLGAGFLSLDTYVPLYVQGGRGGGATAAASVVTPVMLTWAISSMIAAQLLVRWGFRKTALAGACLIATGFAGLLLCTIFAAPHWMLTTVLAITGFGFGPASMSCLLAAQDTVAWQQRGVVTSGITFCRTIGGAIGIGLLGAMFNWLIGPQLQHLKEQGATPAAVLDPSAHHVLTPELLQAVRQMICGGLLWVFGAMLLLALLQILVSARMSGRKVEHKVTTSEAMEAMAG
jgi:EmrB/QacA subfamily drug resistance transporter